MITAERLRELLSYDPETGLFHWRISYRRTKTGDRAGAFSHGYVAIMTDGYLNRAHRLVWLYVHGRWPLNQIDHVNGNRADNRLENLREADSKINGQNKQVAQANNTTGFLGVSFKRKKFRARIKVNGRQLALGSFNTPEAAHEAYLIAKRQHHEGCTL